jgi:hypothetical protein
MIELEEVKMMNVSDDALEAYVGVVGGGIATTTCVIDTGCSGLCGVDIPGIPGL